MAGITFLHSLGGESAIVLQEIVSRYNEEAQYEYQVDLIAKTPQNYAAAAEEALTNPPKGKMVIFAAPEYKKNELASLANKGLFIPSSSILGDEKMGDIAQIVRETFGKYSLPMNPACGILYINRDALRKIEKSDDWVPRSLEEMKEVSKELMEKGIVKYGFTCAWPESYLVETLLTQQDLPLVEPNNGIEGTAIYNLAQLSDHIFELWKEAKEGIFLPPTPGNYDPTKIPFINNEVAFYMQGSGHFSILSKDTKDKFSLDCSALPTLTLNQNEKYAFPLGGSALWIMNPEASSEEKSEYAPNPETSKKMIEGVRSFLNYLTSPAVQKEWHTKTAYVPVFNSTVTELENENFYEDHPLHKAVVDQTIKAKLGKNSFGIKAVNYADARKEIYPLIYELMRLDGSEEEVASIIQARLTAFDEKWSYQSN